MLIVGPDREVVEKTLVRGELGCPDCGQRLARWGWAARRFVRTADGAVRRIRPRRAICSTAAVGCGRSHVLLPRFVLGRRIDEVAVIWAALRARAQGRGWRKITELVSRPPSTVRGWLARFAAHAESIREAFAQLERQVSAGADMDRLVPAGNPAADAVAQIGAACAAVRRSFGEAVFTVSPAQLASACSGGWLLGSAPPRPPGVWINMSPHL